jgi:hypothetical protein
LAVFVVATPTLAHPAAAGAQEVPAPGQRVRVWRTAEAPGARSEEGVLVALAGDSLVLRVAAGRRDMTLRRAEIARLEVSRGRRFNGRNAAAGAVLTALPVVLVGLVRGESCTPPCDGAALGVLGRSLEAGLPWAVAGALGGGLLLTAERWVPASRPASWVDAPAPAPGPIVPASAAPLLPTGTRVRLWFTDRQPGASPRTGTLLAPVADSVVIRQVLTGTVRAVPREAVWRLEVSQGRAPRTSNIGRGAVVGAIPGALAGVVLSSLFLIECQRPCPTAYVLGTGGAIGAVAGGSAGAVISLAFPGPERWRRVPLSRGGSSAPR